MKPKLNNKNKALRGWLLKRVFMGGNEKKRLNHLHGLQLRNGLRWNQ
jgi:hypothetical protein